MDGDVGGGTGAASAAATAAAAAAASTALRFSSAATDHRVPPRGGGGGGGGTAGAGAGGGGGGGVGVGPSVNYDHWKAESPYSGVAPDPSLMAPGASSVQAGGGGAHDIAYGVPGAPVGGGGGGYGSMRGSGGSGGSLMGSGILGGATVENVLPFSGSASASGGGGTAGALSADAGEFMGHPLGQRKNSSVHSEAAGSRSGPTVRVSGKRTWQYNMESKSGWWAPSPKVRDPKRACFFFDFFFVFLPPVSAFFGAIWLDRPLEAVCHPSLVGWAGLGSQLFD